MTETVQKGVISELIDILKLLVILAVRKINLQHILYLTAFLTFGLGDGITAAFMMDKLGTGIEANPIVRYLFDTAGFESIVTGKMGLTFLLLLAIYIIQLRYNMYWTVNGFLIALTAGGLMAVNANLNAMAGEIPWAPGAIIITYLSLMLILIEIGSFVDDHAATLATG